MVSADTLVASIAPAGSLGRLHQLSISHSALRVVGQQEAFVFVKETGGIAVTVPHAPSEETPW